MKQLLQIRNYLLAIAPVVLFSFASPAQYVANFEGTNETKVSYASGTVTLSGIQWDMTDVLIGTLTEDWKNGLRSARLRGYGTSSMTMLQNKPDGIGTITFLYRRYGADTQVDWRVEYSVNDGVTWTQIGQTFTAVATDTVQTFKDSLNVPGNVRIRIKRDTETGTVNRRLNIDDITLTDYPGQPASASNFINPEMMVYPNPVVDQIRVRSQVGVLKVEVLDMAGQVVAVATDTRHIVSGADIVISLASLDKGVYVVKVTTVTGDVGVSKIVKK